MISWQRMGLRFLKVTGSRASLPALMMLFCLSLIRLAN